MFAIPLNLQIYAIFEQVNDITSPSLFKLISIFYSFTRIRFYIYANRHIHSVTFSLTRTRGSFTKEFSFRFPFHSSSMQRNRSIKRSKLFSVLFILASRRLSAEILQFLCLYHHICKTCSILSISLTLRRSINSPFSVRLTGIICCRPLCNTGTSVLRFAHRLLRIPSVFHFLSFSARFASTVGGSLYFNIVLLALERIINIFSLYRVPYRKNQFFFFCSRANFGAGGPLRCCSFFSAVVLSRKGRAFASFF